MKDPERPLSSEETVGICTWNLCLNGLRDAVLGKLAQRITLEERQEIQSLIDGLTAKFTAVFLRDPDPEHVTGLKRRMDCLKINVGFCAPSRGEYVVLDAADASTLLGPALEKCDLECPCVTVDEETGERTVIREAVRRCEMGRVYKRMMVQGSGKSAECPYSLLI